MGGGMGWDGMGLGWLLTQMHAGGWGAGSGGGRVGSGGIGLWFANVVVSQPHAWNALARFTVADANIGSASRRAAVLFPHNAVL